MAFFDEIEQHATTQWVDDPSHQEPDEGMTPIRAPWLRGLDGTVRSVIAALNALRDHKHAASDITSGSLTVARIPNLAQSKITGLGEALDAKADTSAIPSVAGLASQSDVDGLRQDLDELINQLGEGA